MQNQTNEISRLIDNAAGILIDWDGCLAFGDRLAEDALAFLSRYGDKVAILSNNSTHLPEDFHAILAGFGVTLPTPRIVLAGCEALKHAATVAAGGVQVLASVHMRNYAKTVLRMPLVEEDGDCVVLLRDTDFSYRRLENAANALRRGARLIVANPDLTHPGASGHAVPETGALLAALKSCVGRTKLDIEVVGKPSPQLFFKACEALQIVPDDAVMIGDNPYTDIEGARNAGMPAILMEDGLKIDMLAPPLEGAWHTQNRFSDSTSKV